MGSVRRFYPYGFRDGNAGKAQGRLGIFLSLLLVAALVGLIGISGCGSSGDGSSAPSPQPLESRFNPFPPPISPDDEGGIFVGELTRSAFWARQAEKARQDTEPRMNKWFYLVNGVGLDNVDSATPPNVLAVTARAPQGAPNPNGGGPTSVVPLGSSTTPESLWKAVQASGGAVYLRNATSFTTATAQGGDFPNPLLGFSANLLALDLGYVPSWQPEACVFMNQADSPAGDISSFQQWSYDDAGHIIFLGEQGGQLVNSNGNSAVSGNGSAPGNQWYIFPDYYLDYVTSLPIQDPPFPAPPLSTSLVTTDCCNTAISTDPTTAAGQQAAYKWISNYYLTDLTPGETCYQDIRCEYGNLNSDAPSQLKSGVRALNYPGEYETVDFSESDFQIMVCQLYQECDYVDNVQTIFKNYNTLLTQIFMEDQTALPSLYIDLDLSATQPVSAVPLTIVEDICTTLLKLVPTVGGVMSGMMSMGFSVAKDNDNSKAKNMDRAISAEASELYKSLGEAMDFFWDSSANGEQLILENWNMLQLVGPMADKEGYNNLGLLTNTASIRTSATSAYSLAVMKQLLPLAYSLSLNVALDNDNPFDNIDSYNESPYSTFGNAAGSYTVNYLYGNVDYNQYPTQTVMENDLQGNGADMFQLLNALNGWSGLALNTDPSQTNMGCPGTAVTFYNSSPYDLYVTVTPSQGLQAAPGYFWNSNESSAYAWGLRGTEGSASFELRPYGYLPLWVAANGVQDNDMTMGVIFNSELTGDEVASFTFGGDGCDRVITPYAWNESYMSGWNASFNNFDQQSYCPSGFWCVLYQE